MKGVAAADLRMGNRKTICEKAVTSTTNRIQGSKFAEESTPMTTPEIPKIIWTYWDNSTPPKFVQACISGPTNFGKMDVRYRSDWVRLAVLSEQGGIWMDASTIVTGSLETIHRKQQKSRSEAFGYYRRAFTTNPSEPVFESFFIATIGHGKWITSWFNEFNKAFINFHMQDSYIDSLKRIHGLRAFRQLLQKNDVPSFLKIYLASQKILHIDGVAPPYGEDSESGPFWLLSRLDFNEEQYARALLLPFKEHEVPLMFKLRGEARGLLMGLLGNSSTKIWPESIYARFVQEHVVKGERGSGFLSFWSSKSKEKEFVVEDEKDASGVKTGGQRKRTMGAIIGRMLGYNAQ
ncbi:hypothetical protein BC829DRAFT_409301 [Chytridium lagenaria]|nr:hypothetical protein BC829DRAFT_409301 [Chytridium lagenaria]